VNPRIGGQRLLLGAGFLLAFAMRGAYLFSAHENWDLDAYREVVRLGELYGGAGYAVYTLCVSLFFLGSPDGLALPLTHLPGWHGVWWGTVLWLPLELRALAKERVA